MRVLVIFILTISTLVAATQVTEKCQYYPPRKVARIEDSIDTNAPQATALRSNVVSNVEPETGETPASVLDPFGDVVAFRNTELSPRVFNPALYSNPTIPSPKINPTVPSPPPHANPFAAPGAPKPSVVLPPSVAPPAIAPQIITPVASTPATEPVERTKDVFVEDIRLGGNESDGSKPEVDEAKESFPDDEVEYEFVELDDASGDVDSLLKGTDTPTETTVVTSQPIESTTQLSTIPPAPEQHLEEIPIKDFPMGLEDLIADKPTDVSCCGENRGPPPNTNFITNIVVRCGLYKTNIVGTIIHKNYILTSAAGLILVDIDQIKVCFGRLPGCPQGAKEPCIEPIAAYIPKASLPVDDKYCNNVLILKFKEDLTEFGTVYPVDFYGICPCHRIGGSTGYIYGCFGDGIQAKPIKLLPESQVETTNNPKCQHLYGEVGNQCFGGPGSLLVDQNYQPIGLWSYCNETCPNPGPIAFSCLLDFKNFITTILGGNEEEISLIAYDLTTAYNVVSECQYTGTEEGYLTILNAIEKASVCDDLKDALKNKLGQYKSNIDHVLSKLDIVKSVLNIHCPCAESSSDTAVAKN